MRCRIVSVLICALFVCGFATDAFSATQPQTMAVCLNNPVPPGWIAVKTLWTGECASHIQTFWIGNTQHKVDTKIITPILPTPASALTWTYTPVGSTGTVLTLFRSNGQQSQLCKVSVSATAASFVCADITSATLPLADVLRR